MLKFYNQKQRSATKITGFSDHFWTFSSSTAEHVLGVSARRFFKKIKPSWQTALWQRLFFGYLSVATSDNAEAMFSKRCLSDVVTPTKI